MSTKFDKFDYDLVENYYLENLQQNNFWIFGSHSADESKPSSLNADQVQQEFIDKTVFGIAVEPEDMSFMLPISVWRQSTVYVPYDDTALLKDKKFYVVVEPEIEGGDYHIYKCISNAGNAPSLNKPEYVEDIENGIYELADGYVWKYMSSTPFTLFRRFTARGLMPLIRTASVEDVANDGLYSTLVENPTLNVGYELIAGSVENFDSTSSTVLINAPVRLRSSDGVAVSDNQSFDFSTPNFYVGRTLYVRRNEESSEIQAQAFIIVASGIQNGMPFIQTQSNTFIEAGDIVQIVPTIEIRGNGTGATAIARFQDDNIKSVTMLSYGSGYTRAVAEVVDPSQAFDVEQGATRAILRPIISPQGGHGTNTLQELKCKHIGIAKGISSLNGSAIPTTGTYSKVGLVKNPTFADGFDSGTFDNRIKIVADTTVFGAAAGQKITQGAVEGTIHELDDDTIFISDYKGPYSETFVTGLSLDIESGGIDINTIEYSPFEGDVADVLFISDSTPIQRTDDKVEQIRLIIDF